MHGRGQDHSTSLTGVELRPVARLTQETDVMRSCRMQGRQALNQLFWRAVQLPSQTVNNEAQTQCTTDACPSDHLPALRALMTLSVMSCLGLM